MQAVNDLHLQAMDLLDEASIFRLAGDKDQSHELTVKAFKLESQAAWLLLDSRDLEPTRSVLFRSAASIALEIKLPREAERLISAALSGDPPDEIANELRDLLEDVYFNRHLDLRGIVLAPGELQMVIDGDAVGFGMARSDTFIQRLKDFEKLIIRTAERRLGREFRERGRPSKSYTNNFEIYLSTPRAASFAVTLRVGQSDQLELPGLDFTADVVHEVLDSLEAFSVGDMDSLESAIPDEAYRTNFIALAQRLSPDGDQVKTVGFTAVREKTERRVALTRPERRIRQRAVNEAIAISEHTSQDPIELTVVGSLLEADATRPDAGLIEIVDDNEDRCRIQVPRGMMSDIVKPMFEERVIALVRRSGGEMHLLSIELAQDEA
ncbi:hypothetical protein [Luteolibacter luteus]|uniref:hypothetical protein n=1 Tax=Luteolibacter luteus TaxID=2728835 RepID=UPI00197B5560|nr:hypothetical protein [Luteolibacter luteus]